MTTVSDLETMIKKLKLKTCFRGVMMKDELLMSASRDLMSAVKDNECGIVNLNSSDVTTEENKKTGHWIAYFRKNKNNYHFCSYGSPPPNDLVEYLGIPVHTHTFQIQDFGDSICGELAVLFLYLMDRGMDYFDVVLKVLEVAASR